MFSRWVPALLTDEEKIQRLLAAQACLKKFEEDGNKSLDQLITLGETWIHIYEPHFKQEPNASPPKIKKASAICQKILALIFWNANGILLIKYVRKVQKVNDEYLCNLLEHFDQTLQEKRPNLFTEPILFYPDLEQIHHNPLILSKLDQMNYKLLKQPIQSPDFSPSAYFLFTKLENFLQAKRFTDADDAIEAVEQYFQGLPASNYKRGIETLYKHWIECIALGGNYIGSDTNYKFCNEQGEQNRSDTNYKFCDDEKEQNNTYFKRETEVNL